MSFNQTFERLRKERGETMRDVAAAIGVGVGTVQAWTKESRPHPEAAKRLARHYGVSVAQLLDGSALSGFEEDAAPYGVKAKNAQELVIQARQHFEELIRRAQGRPERLTWLTEQMKAFLPVPPNWEAVQAKTSGEKLFDQLTREAREGRPQSEGPDQSKAS